jgi:acyl-CoA synthetase (AMP-forming)/AMP-acid ligase II
VLIELLRRGAAEVPEQPLVISPGGSVSYAELLTRSEALAQGLRTRSVDRFACVVGDVRELLAVLCASTAAGSEACVYPETLDEQGIAEFTGRFEHAFVVSDRKLERQAATVIAPDELAGSGASVAASPSDMPVLILTTGSTGVPKAVRHDWVRLADAVRAGSEPPGVRWLLAYNVNQFAATQVFLHVLVNRATLVVAASRRPRDIVAALREHRVTHVSATPTFWRVLLGALDQETARELHLAQITLGGEAVPEFVLDRLRDLFPEARTSQIYAITEYGSCVSVRDGRNGLPASILNRDDDAPVRFRIVDGQLEVLSRVQMKGYWGQDQIREEWRPTGDLVELRGDRIHFVGRASDTINVGGVKVHPLPVEERVAAVPGVELARAYGRPNPVTGQIVVLDVVARAGADLEALEAQIRQACSSLGPAARPRRIRFVPELEVRGQKIVRVTA